MKISTTNLIAEHLLGGFLTILALYLFLAIGISGVRFSSELPNPLISIAVLLSFSYIVGVVMSHFVARMFEGSEIKINLKVFEYEFPDSGYVLLPYFKNRGLNINLNSGTLDSRLESIERIFGAMRYSLLSDRNLQERLSYYRMMIRVCRNNVIPIIMNAVSVTYLTVTNVIDSKLIGYSLVTILAVLAIGCFLAMRGYTEWMGHATVRAFVARNAITNGSNINNLEKNSHSDVAQEGPPPSSAVS